jgi:hypothetical protein
MFHLDDHLVRLLTGGVLLDGSSSQMPLKFEAVWATAHGRSASATAILFMR